MWVRVLFGFKQELELGLLNLPTPVVISYWWGLGVSLGFVYVLQVLSGLLLSAFYAVGGVDGGFSAVVIIMMDVKWGWLLRMLHCGGVSLYFMLLYGHMLRGLLYGSFGYRSVWGWGLLVYVFSIIVAFLGYVLPWGSMSYWGMVVVTSVVGVLPGVGGSLMELIWGSVSMPGVFSLSRFFSLHYILSLGVGLLALLHMLELHSVGSSNPLGVSVSVMEGVPFHDAFSYKDGLVLVWVLGLYWYLVLVNPHIVMDAVNYEEINNMSTPTHIKPEWYFLYLYCILRSVPSKGGGVVLMCFAVVVIWMFAFFILHRGGTVSLLSFKVGLMLFTLSFGILTALGGKAVEFPYYELSGLFVLVYYISILVMWCSLVCDVQKVSC
nr:cytochrome b [Pseudoacanthocephalus sp.]